MPGYTYCRECGGTIEWIRDEKLRKDIAQPHNCACECDEYFNYWDALRFMTEFMFWCSCEGNNLLYRDVTLGLALSNKNSPMTVSCKW